MKLMFIAGAASACLIIPALADNQAVSLKGRWHVDFNRSINIHADDLKSVTTNIITDDGKIFKSEETVVYKDGETTSESINTHVDGRFYPVLGSSNNVSASISHWSPGSVEIKLKTSYGLIGVQNCQISKDLSTLTCKEVDTNLRGEGTSTTSVYVRE